MKKYDLTPQEINTMSGIDGLLKLVGISRHKAIKHLERLDTEELSTMILPVHKTLANERRNEFREGELNHEKN